MKIVFFIGSMGRGGAERVISILSNEYAENGWDVDIVMMLQNEVGYQLHPNIRTISFAGSSASYIKNVPHWLMSIRKYLRKEKPDRVVSFAGRINALVLTASIGIKVPIIVSERNDPKHDGRGKAMLWYCNKIYHRAKKIVFQNKYEQSCFEKSLESKGVVVPNPIQVSVMKRPDNQEFVIATAGRLSAQKNTAMLVDAMELVHKVHPEVKCKIFGDGELRETLQERINEKKLTDVVTLEGNRKDIHEQLSKCSLFVMTSEFEGLSNALIEAMMMGLPCVTTDYPGADELITDGVNGVIVERGNANELADIIIQILNGDIDTISLARYGIAASDNYRKERVLQLWHSEIDDVML